MKEVDIEGVRQQAWVIKKDSMRSPTRELYLSVNAVTIEPRQEGCDLREWHEKGWINYLDINNPEDDQRHTTIAHEGGMY